MDGGMEMGDMDKKRDREEQREREDYDNEDLDERGQQETDFGGGSHGDSIDVPVFPRVNNLPNVSGIKKPTTVAVGEFVRARYNTSIRWDSDDAIELHNRISTSRLGNIVFHEKNNTGGVIQDSRVVLNYNNGDYKYNKTKTNANAVNQFHEILKRLVNKARVVLQRVCQLTQRGI